MRRSHFAAWAPHCPICARDHGRFPALLLGDDATEDGCGDVHSAILVCADPACRAEYPVIAGLPVIMPTLRQHLGERAVELLLRDDLDDRALSLLGDAMGPESWLDGLRQTLSTYAWDSYAGLDPAEAAPPGPAAPRPGGAARCLDALLDLAAPFDPAVATAVLDLGCAAGGTAFDCAARAPGALVLGIDGNLSLLRLARQAATRGTVAYGRRRIGMVYDTRRFAADLPGRGRVDFWACDATALPFRPAAADLVVALNLIDCVPDPVHLLHAMAAVLRPGGALLLATPFDWAARATPSPHWIGGHSQRGEGGGAAEPLLHSLLRPGGHPGALADMALAATGEADWHTRLHDRSAVMYRSHLVAVHKGFPPKTAGQEELTG